MDPTHLSWMLELLEWCDCLLEPKEEHTDDWEEETLDNLKNIHLYLLNFFFRMILPVLMSVCVCRPRSAAGADRGTSSAVRAGGRVSTAAACLRPNCDRTWDRVMTRWLKVWRLSTKLTHLFYIVRMITYQWQVNPYLYIWTISIQCLPCPSPLHCLATVDHRVRRWVGGISGGQKMVTLWFIWASRGRRIGTVVLVSRHLQCCFSLFILSVEPSFCNLKHLQFLLCVRMKHLTLCCILVFT